jgi:multicomponent Na+:H+ antiporter subunit A
MILASIALHGVLAILAPTVARRVGRRVFLLCAIAPLVTFAGFLTVSRDVLDGNSRRQHLDWVPGMDLSFDFHLDAFALLMVLLVSGVGVAVLVYSTSYFTDQPALGRFAATLTVFAGSMLGVVLSDNVLSLYVFWELTSVTSYLLIGFDDRKEGARAAALQALLVTGGGGLAMLAGLVVLGQEAGTYSLSALLADPPTGTAVEVALVLVLLGAFTKSAQVPFHSWLPGAMAAPTPVSAYLHSATMVKAGVYLIARFAPAYADTSSLWRPLVVSVGLATMLIGGLRALRQIDIKLLMAHSTVSQLGLLVVLFGMGTPALTFVAVGLLVAHALFKAALFMVVGIVDHQAHTRNIGALRGIARRMPATAVVAILGIASMIGLPPLLGFVVKEAMYEELLHDAHTVVVVGVVVGSILTFAYGLRFLWGAFFHGHRDPTGSPVDVHAPGRTLLVPAAALAGAGLVAGVATKPVASALGDMARALDPSIASPSLYLWHGVTTALLLTVVTVATGTGLFLLRVRVAWTQERLAPTISAQGAYERSIRLLNRSAVRVTAILQNGSLPVYIGVILLTATLVPGWVLVRFAESPLQVAVGAGVLAAAIVTAMVNRRFVAVMCLGAVGLGVAVLYVMQGAPDLALTQLLVETVILVIFVLVLRHLPERFEGDRWKTGRRLRLGIALVVGTFFGAFTVLAAADRTGPPVSATYLDRALPDGGGRNVVNVILTDFRALDTLGEVTVLAVAALGIASLVRAGRSDRVDRADPSTREDGTRAP